MSNFEENQMLKVEEDNVTNTQDVTPVSSNGCTSDSIIPIPDNNKSKVMKKDTRHLKKYLNIFNRVLNNINELQKDVYNCLEEINKEIDNESVVECGQLEPKKSQKVVAKKPSFKDNVLNSCFVNRFFPPNTSERTNEQVSADINSCFLDGVLKSDHGAFLGISELEVSLSELSNNKITNKDASDILNKLLLIPRTIDYIDRKDNDRSIRIDLLAQTSDDNVILKQMVELQAIECFTSIEKQLVKKSFDSTMVNVYTISVVMCDGFYNSLLNIPAITHYNKIVFGKRMVKSDFIKLVRSFAPPLPFYREINNLKFAETLGLEYTTIDGKSYVKESEMNVKAQKHAKVYKGMFTSNVISMLTADTEELSYV